MTRPLTIPTDARTTRTATDAALATHRFLVDGVPVTYAGYTCLEHGERVCAEYASVSEAVGVWTVEPLNEVTNDNPPICPVWRIRMKHCAGERRWQGAGRSICVQWMTARRLLTSVATCAAPDATHVPARRTWTIEELSRHAPLTLRR